MASRLRESEKFFEMVLEVEKKYYNNWFIDDNKNVSRNIKENENFKDVVNFVYPSDTPQDLINPVLQFLFPFDIKFAISVVDHFTFTMTGLDGKFKFGFCRISSSSCLCHCIISCHPWYEVFYKMLNEFAELRNNTAHNNDNFNTKSLRKNSKSEMNINNNNNADDDDGQLVSWLDSLINLSQLFPNNKLSNYPHPIAFFFEVPDQSKLMSVPTSRNLTEFCCAINTKNIAHLFANLLFERQVIVVSNKLSRLTSCVTSSASLLYPLHWQHIFIPILPPYLTEILTATMPYLIGIHASIWQKVPKDDLKDVVVLDVDLNYLESPHNDLNRLPLKIVRKLMRNLKGHNRSSIQMFHGDTVPRAFLKLIASLFGGYRKAFRTVEGEVVFDQEAFINSRSKPYHGVLRDSLQSQAFLQFIDEKLMNMSGKQPVEMVYDSFEQEVTRYNNKKQALMKKSAKYLSKMKYKDKEKQEKKKQQETETTKKTNNLNNIENVRDTDDEIYANDTMRDKKKKKSMFKRKLSNTLVNMFPKLSSKKSPKSPKDLTQSIVLPAKESVYDSIRDFQKSYWNNKASSINNFDQYSQLSGDLDNSFSDVASLNKSPSLPSMESPFSKINQFSNLKIKKGGYPTEESMYDYPRNMKPLESSLYSDPSSLKLRSLSSSLLDDFDSLSKNILKKVEEVDKNDDEDDEEDEDDSCRYSEVIRDSVKNDFINGKLMTENNFLSLDAPSVCKSSRKESRISCDNNNNYIRLKNNNSSILGNKLKVQQLIEKFESTRSENTLSFAYPGTYFCNDIKYKQEKANKINKNLTTTLTKNVNNSNSSNQISDLIISKTISLQSSTEQWKKKINSNNISDLPRNINISERLDKLKVKDHLSNSLRSPKVIGLYKSQNPSSTTLSRLEIPNKYQKVTSYYKDYNTSPLSYVSEPGTFSKNPLNNNRVEEFSHAKNDDFDNDLSVSPSFKGESLMAKLSRKDKFKSRNTSKKSLKSQSSTSSIFYTDLPEQMLQADENLFRSIDHDSHETKENAVNYLSSVCNPIYSTLNNDLLSKAAPQYSLENTEYDTQQFCDTLPAKNSTDINQQKPLGPKFFTNSNSLEIQRDKIKIESTLSSPSGAIRSCLQRRKAFKMKQGSSCESPISSLRSSYIDSSLKARCGNDDDTKDDMGFKNPVFVGSEKVKIKPKLSRNKTWSQDDFCYDKINKIADNIYEDENFDANRLTLNSENLTNDENANDFIQASDTDSVKVDNVKMDDEMDTSNHLNNSARTSIKSYKNKNKNSLTLFIDKDLFHLPSHSSSSSPSTFYTPNIEVQEVFNKNGDSCTKERNQNKEKHTSIKSNYQLLFEDSRKTNWNNESSA